MLIKMRANSNLLRQQTNKCQFPSSTKECKLHKETRSCPKRKNLREKRLIKMVNATSRIDANFINPNRLKLFDACLLMISILSLISSIFCASLANSTVQQKTITQIGSDISSYSTNLQIDNSQVEHKLIQVQSGSLIHQPEHDKR